MMFVSGGQTEDEAHPSGETGLRVRRVGTQEPGGIR